MRKCIILEARETYIVVSFNAGVWTMCVWFIPDYEIVRASTRMIWTSSEVLEER